VAPTNGSVATWEHYDYDGLGRRIRERRLLPAAQVSKRFTLYDGPGRAYFESEWIADGTAETFSRLLPTACVFASSPAWPTARAAAAPGTLRLCYDPFGRPQQVVGSRHSSLATFDRSDAAHPYSVVAERAKTYCVNAAFADLQQATCAAGGLKPETTARRDAFGRLVQVTEPTGDATSYAWDVGGALSSVSQGGQARTFQRDASGRLRSETTPEGGTATADVVGSIGNVRQETRGGVVVTRDFDFAGRPTRVRADGATYVVQCWDGAPLCVDGSPGYAGGAWPAGRLTRRYGYNRIPTIGPVADEQFEYGGSGGRLSRLVAALGNGDLAASASQSWTYDNLGLATSHDHPRFAGSGSFSESTAYSNALPSSVAASGQAVVAATTWNAASGLASWRAGNSGTPVKVSIAPDASLLPRPASISSPVWSSGAYAYDGAGDVLSIGADTFRYDARTRLTSATYGAAARGFAYDRWGNLTANGPTGIGIDPATNRVSDGGAQYDSRGDLTAWGGESLAWDGLARQYRNTNASSDWVYLYTGSGERMARFPAKFGVLRREMARWIAEANVLAKGWTLPACAGAFADVPCTDPDARQIQLVSDEGVSGGCATNPARFCPDAALNRAQLAVFVVKGYKPDGFVPPACQGTFQDVACGGPYAAFAPWIEQLYRDGVTGGCATNPLRYCPGNSVGEWEALVWLAKAPGATPGSAFWSAYHPVPRGTTYTWRDDSGRVVTEATGGASGPATAGLTISRDNVFLGNLLVASYVTSPPGWQYTVSDHLGSPRAVFNQSGQLVETHKHWPYGEDASATPPAQRLSFCLMERDAEATRYYDHARTHDYTLGRFLSPDSVGGRPENPQSWNRYAYTLGNPLKHVDPDGLLTIVVHGTWANGKSDFLPGGRFYEHVVSTAPDRAFASFQWSGGDSHAARIQAAKDLAAFVKGYKFAEGEPLNIIAHSHGGNVAIMAINLGLGHDVDNFVTLGTPSRTGYRLARPGDVANWVNLFNSHDGIQKRGGGDQESPLEFGAAARTHPFALNINWNMDFGPIESHEMLHSPPAWDFVLPHLQIPLGYDTQPVDHVIN
jgi:RHS repeat-associated protein